MRPKQNRNPTRQPQPSQLAQLLDGAALRLLSLGTVRVGPAPYLTAAWVLVATAQCCGWEANTTAQQLLERHLGQRGWAWRWEGKDLVLMLPGWTPPAPVIVAIQPSLFD